IAPPRPSSATLPSPPLFRSTQCKNVRQPVNIVSHFARADEPKCGATEKQLAIFNTFCEGKPGQRSIAASGGILLWPQSHFDWVRDRKSTRLNSSHVSSSIAV